MQGELQAIHDAFRPKRERMLTGLQGRWGCEWTVHPRGPSTCGEMFPRSRRPSTTAWDSALRWSNGSSPCPRVLRHQPRQAQARAGLALPWSRALLLRSVDGEVVERALERLGNVVRARAAVTAGVDSGFPRVGADATAHARERTAGDGVDHRDRPRHRRAGAGRNGRASWRWLQRASGRAHHRRRGRDAQRRPGPPCRTRGSGRIPRRRPPALRSEPGMAIRGASGQDLEFYATVPGEPSPTPAGRLASTTRSGPC